MNIRIRILSKVRAFLGLSRPKRFFEGLTFEEAYRMLNEYDLKVAEDRLNNLLTHFNEVFFDNQFDHWTEKEVLYLWKSLKARGLPSREVQAVIVIGIALDMAFDRSGTQPRTVH